MLADQPSHRTYSQHANTLAILSGAIPKRSQKELFECILRDDDQIAQPHLLPRLHQLCSTRSQTRRSIPRPTNPPDTACRRRLTTWAEEADNTRSDCYASGARPKSRGATWRASIKARMPHPKRETCASQPGINGEFEWRGAKRKLVPCANHLVF